MTLEARTVAPLVDTWSAGWTAADKGSIGQLLVKLSAQVTSHIVPDIALADDRTQRYLLARAIARLEDWLIGAAATLRAAYRLDAPHLSEHGDPALGLRSATVAEIEALPAVGKALAQTIASFLARRPEITTLEPLADVDGIGPGRLQRLKGVAYVERPRLGLISPALWRFIASPTVESFLAVLHHTDLELFFGDYNTLVRHTAGAVAGAPVARFVRFLQLVVDQSTRAARPIDGVLASDADRWLARHDLRSKLLGSAAEARGAVLISSAYIPAAKQLITGATASVNLMAFLATAANAPPEGVAPLDLIEAMEAAAARGVTVRAILDQDDNGVPYRSYFINRPLVERFRAKGIGVKFDEKDTLLHSKVLIVDQVKAVVGSHNWTRDGFNDTHEVSILVDSSQVAAQFEARFQALWNRLPAIA